MEIKNGEPWVLWPSSVSYGLNKGEIESTFEGDSDFTLSMEITISTSIKEKRTIFAKLPNYMGFDIEGNNGIFIFTLMNENNVEETKYMWIDNCINDGHNVLTFRYNKENNLLQVIVDDITKLDYKIEDGFRLSKYDNTHIVFGAGNFPHNGFNLNYAEYQIDHLIIAKNYLSYNEIIGCFSGKNITPKNTVALYDFNTKTTYKIYDLTGNCNFIHKIIY